MLVFIYPKRLYFDFLFGDKSYNTIITQNIEKKKNMQHEDSPYTVYFIFYLLMDKSN